jgi:hypothetical protein
MRKLTTTTHIPFKVTYYTITFSQNLQHHFLPVVENPLHVDLKHSS